MCAILLVSCGLIQEAICSKGEFCLFFFSVDNFSSLMTYFPIIRRTLYSRAVFLILQQEFNFDPTILVYLIMKAGLGLPFIA